MTQNRFIHRKTKQPDNQLSLLKKNVLKDLFVNACAKNRQQIPTPPLKIYLIKISYLQLKQALYRKDYADHSPA